MQKVSKVVLVNVLVFAVTTFLICDTLYGQDGKDIEEKLRKVVEEATDKTVEIVAEFGGKEISLGSGAIISADGYIVTNAHVVMSTGYPFTESKIFAIIKANKKSAVKIVGFDATKDTALVKADEMDLSYFEFGDSDTLKEGDFVVALGYPAVFSGIEHKKYEKPCASFGKIKETDKKLPLGFTVLEGISTDTPLSYGNSGGPLVNLDGKLVGINTAIEFSKGIKSFANPSKIVEEVVEKIKKREAENEPELFNQLEQLVSLAKTIYKMYSEALKEEVVTEETVTEEVRTKELKNSLKGINKKVKNNIVKIIVNGNEVGYGYILNKEGYVVTSRYRVFAQDALSFTVDKLKEYAQKYDFLKEFLGEELLSTEKKFSVKILKENISLDAVFVKDFPDNGIVFLKVALPDDLSLSKLNKSAQIERGKFAVTVTESDLPIALGLISTDDLEVEAASWVPGSFEDLFKFFEDINIFTPKRFKSVLFHDSLIESKNLGSPVLNSKGEFIGLNLYSPTKGFTYAISLNDILKLLEKIEKE